MGKDFTREDKIEKIKKAIRLVDEEGMKKTAACKTAGIPTSSQVAWFNEFPTLAQELSKALEQQREVREKPSVEGIIALTYLTAVRDALESGYQIGVERKGIVKMHSRQFLGAIENNDVAFFERFGVKPIGAAKIISTYQPILKTNIKGDKLPEELENNIKALAGYVADLIAAQFFRRDSSKQKWSIPGTSTGNPGIG